MSGKEEIKMFNNLKNEIKGLQKVNVIKKEGKKVINICTLYTSKMKQIMKDTRGFIFSKDNELWLLVD